MIAQAIAGALAGCVGCQAGVELLDRQVKNSLNLLTLTTCVFVSLEGLIFYSKLFTVKLSIPIRVYLKIAVLFFFVNLCNNYAVRCNIYFPLFIIFKSGSLLANIVFGYLLRGHHYSSREVFAVLMVTGGIAIFTLASYEPKASAAAPASSEMSMFLSIPIFFIGIALLTIALTLSAYLGVCQEDMYRIYGKHAKESMYMVHFLSIPAFALVGNDIVEAFYAASNTPPISMLGYDMLLPSAWCSIFGICILQSKLTDSVAFDFITAVIL